LLIIEKILFSTKQTHVHTEKTRGAGVEMTRKNEIQPATFIGSLCKSHAVLVLKIADVHRIGT